MSRGTLDPASLTRLSLTGLSPSLAGLSRTVLLGSFMDFAVRTPACSHPGLGSSGFARRYFRNRCFFLFLRLLRCFSSPGSLRMPMDSAYGDRGSLCRVSPFRHLRIFGYLLLPAAFRSLSRLSSALSAKASSLCSSQLNLLNSSLFSSLSPACIALHASFCCFACSGCLLSLIFFLLSSCLHPPRISSAKQSQIFDRFSSIFGFQGTAPVPWIGSSRCQMGLSGLEPPTSRLSGVRSNLLSYKPFLIRQPPTLPYRPQYSTIGRLWLNLRVRDENGCLPQAHRHRISSMPRVLLLSFHSPQHLNSNTTLTSSLERR